MHTALKYVAVLTIGLIPVCSSIAQSGTERSYSEMEKPFRWGIEEMEFIYEPSFRDGLLVLVFPPRAGRAEVFAYKLHRKAGTEVEFHSFVPAHQLAKTQISAEAHRALVAAFEGRDVQEASERSMVGPDGSSWIFRRQIGGRSQALRFWSPALSSRAGDLAGKFLLAAGLSIELLDERKRPNKAPEPTPGSVTPRAEDPKLK